MNKSIQKAKQPADKPMRIYAKITTALTIIMTLVTLAGAYITYPTQAHRDANAKITAFNKTATKNGFNSDIYASREYKDLESSAEVRYSMTAGVVLILAQAVMGVTLAGATYNYLRKNFISKSRRALGATVVMNVLAGTISYLATLLVISKISNIPAPSAGEIVGATVMSLIFGAILTFIVVSIFERLYNRKHSFIVD